MSKADDIDTVTRIRSEMGDASDDELMFVLRLGIPLVRALRGQDPYPDGAPANNSASGKLQRMAKAAYSGQGPVSKSGGGALANRLRGLGWG